MLLLTHIHTQAHDTDKQRRVCVGELIFGGCLVCTDCNCFSIILQIFVDSLEKRQKKQKQISIVKYVKRTAALDANITFSLFTHSWADWRTYVCMYVCVNSFSSRLSRSFTAHNSNTHTHTHIHTIHVHVVRKENYYGQPSVCRNANIELWIWKVGGVCAKITMSCLLLTVDYRTRRLLLAAGSRQQASGSKRTLTQFLSAVGNWVKYTNRNLRLVVVAIAIVVHFKSGKLPVLAFVQCNCGW